MIRIAQNERSMKLEQCIAWILMVAGHTFLGNFCLACFEPRVLLFSKLEIQEMQRFFHLTTILLTSIHHIYHIYIYTP